MKQYLCFVKKMIKKSKQQKLSSAIGTHIIADLYACKKLDNNAFVKDILLRSAKISRGTVLHTKFHNFRPQGMTGYILLAESHISIHTWPETGYAAVDVFTCGEAMDPKSTAEFICEKLGASEIQLNTIKRKRIRPEK